MYTLAYTLALLAAVPIYDLVMILDKDGDGEIDYQEFARWFGRGAPPPPMLPQAKAAQQAQADRAASGFDSSALLREIEKAGRSRRPPPPPPRRAAGQGALLLASAAGCWLPLLMPARSQPGSHLVSPHKQRFETFHAPKSFHA
eukprot:COSAG02_NODE_35468_length_468_cov_0.487805_1_plen_143_part_10